MTTKRETIEIRQVRAKDVQSSDVIRIKPTGDWRYVYENDTDMQANGAYAGLMDESDERYVLLRLENHPRIEVTAKYDHTLHIVRPDVTIRGGRPERFGVPSEWDDVIVPFNEYDLIDIQVVV